MLVNNAQTTPRRLTVTGADGLTLVADALGDPAARPVLLLHGGGQTRHAWSRTARALADRGWYAVSFDLRGHGDSQWSPNGDYSMVAFIADFHAMCDVLHQPPVVVGASMGGITALMAEGEATAPLTAGLVLVDIATRMEAEGVARIVRFMSAHPDGFASLEEAADAVAGYLHHRPRPSDTTGLAKNLRKGDDGRYRWHWDPQFITGEQRPAATGDTERLDRAAAALTVPTLLVRGKLSDLLSEEGAAHFLTLVPHAQFADVSDAGHMVAGDVNDVFTDAVLRFLADLPAPTS